MIGLGGLIVGLVAVFIWSYRRLNRRIALALEQPTELERSTRRLYDEPDGLARELLEEVKP